MLHLGNGISTLPKTTGNDVVLSNNSTDGAPTSFKVILMESTTRSLVLESFYNEHIAGKCIDGVTYTKTSLGAAGISRVAFSTTLGRTQGQDPLHDRTSPGFKVKGFGAVPMCHQGYRFTQHCLIVRSHLRPSAIRIQILRRPRFGFLGGALHPCAVDRWRILVPATSAAAGSDE